MFISFGEVLVITLVGMIALKPSEITPIMKKTGEIVEVLKLKITTIFSDIKHYFK